MRQHSVAGAAHRRRLDRVTARRRLRRLRRLRHRNRHRNRHRHPRRGAVGQFRCPLTTASRWACMGQVLEGVAEHGLVLPQPARRAPLCEGGVGQQLLRAVRDEVLGERADLFLDGRILAARRGADDRRRDEKCPE
ncbi:hypothetical protein ACIHCQ_27005 [Streptomyces sp. NPDC052236]|uniref:hypothetical protein n=1 Tax=Streptomyces sp. NPDC052236 TaxID=3365686 RepID=UPI0037D027A9